MDFTPKEIQRFVIALGIGCLIGFGMNYSTKPEIKDEAQALGAFKAKLTYGIAKEGMQKCTITADTAELRSEPSNMRGKVLMELPKKLEVEFIRTVRGTDTDSNEAVAAYDLQFSRLFHRTVYIPQGTKFTIEGFTNDEYVCRFTIDGKTYSKRFERELVKRAYVGDWQQVKLNTQEGYIQAVQASAPKYY